MHIIACIQDPGVSHGFWITSNATKRWAPITRLMGRARHPRRTFPTAHFSACFCFVAVANGSKGSAPPNFRRDQPEPVLAPHGEVRLAIWP